MLLWAPIVLGFVWSWKSFSCHRSGRRCPVCTIAERRPRGLLRSLHSSSGDALSVAIGSNEPSRQRNEQQQATMKWILRPATIHDHDCCAALIQQSFGTLLRADYSEECLSMCLPLITQPRHQLLTCNTWYLVEHPSTRQIVGCGGWTVRRPRVTNATSVGNETLSNTSSRVIEPSEQNHSESVQLMPQLRHFAVHPDYLRLGIAAAIWNRTRTDIAAQFEAENRSFPVLQVFSTLTGEPFYQSLGFVSVQRVDFQLIKDGIFPTIFMLRDPTVVGR
jgi:GNAT superfamily N-acetyltransferase